MKKTHLLAIVLALFAFQVKAQFTTFNTIGTTGAGFSGTAMILNDGVAGGSSESTSIWNNTPVDFANSFVIDFEIYIGPSTNRADGITFTFQNEGTNTVKNGGGHLGVSSGWTTGISPSIIAEFDVFRNVGYDPSYDHFAVSTNGNLASPIVPATAITTTGGWHAVTVIWDCDNLTYEYDGVVVGVVSHSTVLSTLGGTTALYGFTGAIHHGKALLKVDNVNLDIQGPCTCNADFEILLNQANEVTTIGSPLGVGANETYEIYDGTTIGPIYSGGSVTNFPLAPGSYEICRTVTLENGTSCRTCFRFCVFTPADEWPEGPSNEENEQGATGQLDLELNDVMLSPNPGSDVINIDGLENSLAYISVVNISGQIVQEYSQEIVETHQLNISDLENGVYLIRITQGEQTHSVKFIKE